MMDEGHDIKIQPETDYDEKTNRSTIKHWNVSEMWMGSQGPAGNFYEVNDMQALIIQLDRLVWQLNKKGG